MLPYVMLHLLRPRNCCGKSSCISFTTSKLYYSFHVKREAFEKAELVPLLFHIQRASLRNKTDKYFAKLNISLQVPASLSINKTIIKIQKIKCEKSRTLYINNLCKIHFYVIILT